VRAVAGIELHTQTTRCKSLPEQEHAALDLRGAFSIGASCMEKEVGISEVVGLVSHPSPLPRHPASPAGGFRSHPTVLSAMGNSDSDASLRAEAVYDGSRRACWSLRTLFKLPLSSSSSPPQHGAGRWVEAGVGEGRPPH
jgi:hypothetical protein